MKKKRKRKNEMKKRTYTVEGIQSQIKYIQIKIKIHKNKK